MVTNCEACECEFEPGTKIRRLWDDDEFGNIFPVYLCLPCAEVLDRPENNIFEQD